ncbi:MAG: DUF3168 domain-containing protein [Anaerolineae bacterium]|nr:DUF3168 domain-containing protein [Anaerolineae bacterium]
MTAYGMVGKVRSAIKDALNVTAVTDLLYNQSADSIAWLDASAVGGKPYILIELVGGGDENASPTRQREVVYTVKAVADTADAAEQIDAQIDAQLHEGTLTISGWQTVSMVRENDLADTQDDGGGGTEFVIGGQYRIRIGMTS